MGAGKSAIGRELSRRIGWPRHDTDRNDSRAVRHFDSGYFRAARRASISRCGNGIAGKHCAEESLESSLQAAELFCALKTSSSCAGWAGSSGSMLMKKCCGSAFQSTCPPCSKHWIHARFAELLQERLPLYQSAADYRINTTSNSIAQVTDEIIALI